MNKFKFSLNFLLFFIVFLGLFSLIFAVDCPDDDGKWVNECFTGANLQKNCGKVIDKCMAVDPKEAINTEPIKCFDANPDVVMEELKKDSTLIKDNPELMDKAFGSEQKSKLLNILNSNENGVLSDSTILGKIESYFLEDVSVLNDNINIKQEYFKNTYDIFVRPGASFKSFDGRNCETFGSNSCKINLDDFQNLKGGKILDDGSIVDKDGREFKNVNLNIEGNLMTIMPKKMDDYLSKSGGLYPDILSKKYYSQGGFYSDGNFYTSQNEISINLLDDSKYSVEGKEVKIYDINSQSILYEFTGQAIYRYNSETYEFKKGGEENAEVKIYIGSQEFKNNFVEVEIKKGGFILDNKNKCESTERTCASFNYKVFKKNNEIKEQLSQENKQFYDENYNNILNNLINKEKSETGLEEIDSETFSKLEDSANLKVIQQYLDSRINNIKEEYEGVDQSYTNDVRYQYLIDSSSSLRNAQSSLDSKSVEKIVDYFNSGLLNIQSLDVENKFVTSSDVKKMGGSAYSSGVSYNSAMDVSDFLVPPPASGVEGIASFLILKSIEHMNTAENVKKIEPVLGLYENENIDVNEVSEKLASIQDIEDIEGYVGILKSVSKSIGVTSQSEDEKYKETYNVVKKYILNSITLSNEYQQSTPRQREVMLEKAYFKLGIY